MEKDIREPRQERAKQKKDAIIKAAYQVFSDVGYYKTNTADIAKVAKVSTGIVYDYFKDKRDILFYVIKIYIDDVKTPILDFIDGIHAPIETTKLIEDIIDLVIHIHNSNENIHNILHSLADTHNDINEEFLELESFITKKGTEKLEELGFDKTNLTEKVHLIMDMVQSFAHESLYDKHDYIDYAAMRKFVVKSITTILEN